MNEGKDIKKKVLDKKTAILKAQQYCAYQERCQQEVRDKLYEWGLHQNDVEQIIVELIELNFINEERFAIQFAGGKFRIKKWGKLKIKNALKFKKISPYCIRKALELIDDKEYMECLHDLLKKKAARITEKNKYKRFSSIAAFAVSKGYEPELVRVLMNNEDEMLI
ncbi:MAG: regulatory protein RecX [Bacteroidetes bacterium]|nr:regulatory protein RecX [Bacteroidota bacterium]